MLRQFTLIYWKDADWYVGRLKSVPGVFSQAKTLEGLEKNIQDAFQKMIEADAIPEEAAFRTEVEIDIDDSPNLTKSIRRYRLKLMGLEAQEIDELCDLNEYPATVDDELKQIAAYKRARDRSSRLKWHG